MHDGVSKLKFIDHQGLFSKDGKVEDGIIGSLKMINPEYIISIIDVSPFSEPLEKQINLISEVKEKFKNKKNFLIANKVDNSSKNKLKRIEETFGKNFYRVRINKPADIKELRDDLIGFLKKG
jgi:GTP1/Obg family GTP-binding protein